MVRVMVSSAIPALQRAAEEKGWRRTVERDFQRAVETAGGVRSRAVNLERWPAVGSVDVLLSGGVGLELKWCKSGNALGNCAWDVAKLGCAIAEGQLAAGLIAAGAPAEHWRTAAPGVGLFDSRSYPDDAIVREYESWWRFWCKDVNTRPVRLPHTVSVIDEASVSAELDGVPFVLRLAQVTVNDASWRTHVCPHRWRNELCPPRPWDPHGWCGVPPAGM
jgi:hypothetical protein